MELCSRLWAPRYHRGVQGQRQSDSNSVGLENSLNFLEIGHLSSFKLREFDLAVHINFECSALHELSLDHGSNKEQKNPGLPFIILHTLVKVLHHTWHSFNSSEEAEHKVSSEKEDKSDGSSPAN